MSKYILKRLLVMVPTFLLITLLVFVIVNLAPGEPGQAMGAAGSESADQSANAREGYRLFKEQYNLDKPIIINMRFLISQGRVNEELAVVARNMSSAIEGEREALAVGATSAAVVSGIINGPYRELEQQLEDESLSDADREELQRRLQSTEFVSLDAFRPERPTQGEVFRAEERLENWGHDIVPMLFVALTDVWGVYDSTTGEERIVTLGVDAERHGDNQVSIGGKIWDRSERLSQKIAFLAAQRLSVNARRRLVIRPGERASEDKIELNREITSEISQLAQMTYPITADAETKQEIISAWQAWYANNGHRYEKSTGDHIWAFFFETRFARYWGSLARLDLGTSIRYQRPVLEIIREHWQYSILLSLLSLFFAYFISVPIGILAAVKQNSFADRGIGIMLFVLYSLPSFFIGTLVQTYLTKAGGLDIFPVSGFSSVSSAEATTWGLMTDVLWHLVLPVFCLTYTSLAVLSRYARTGLLDVIRSDYIRTARAKGLSEWVVIMKHAVRNGMIPILTLLGSTLPVLIGGSIIIEYIFVIDGMGRLMLTAIAYRDYNVIMGILLISSILTLLGLLLSDISYALVDPRISFD